MDLEQKSKMRKMKLSVRTGQVTSKWSPTVIYLTRTFSASSSFIRHSLSTPIMGPGTLGADIERLARDHLLTNQQFLQQVQAIMDPNI